MKMAQVWGQTAVGLSPFWCSWANDTTSLNLFPHVNMEIMVCPSQAWKRVREMT